MIRHKRKDCRDGLLERFMKRMKRTAFVVFSLFALVISTAFVSIHKPIIGQSVAGKGQAARAPQAANPRIVESYGKLPLSFEANEGQSDSQVKFIAHGSGYSLFLTSTEAVLSLQEPPAEEGPGITQISTATFPSAKSAAVLKMKLVGASPSPQLTSRDQLPGKSNYFIGSDPAKWRTNVPSYAKVKYANVYPGIDLVYYGNQRQLEYDFVVAPGADPRAIRLAIDGHRKRRIDAMGDLVLDVERSELRLHRPVIYQEINGVRQHITGNFTLHGIRQVGFEVAQYDVRKPLIIDPVLSYSTYLGGSGDDGGRGIAVDSSDNAYVTGYTASSDFRIRDIGKAIEGPENDLLAGWYNKQRAVILAIQRVPGANVIETVDRVKALLPQLEASLPPAIKVTIAADRTTTIRAAVADVQFTLLLTVALVVMVIFLFLRNLWATVIPGGDGAAVSHRHLRGALCAGLQPR